MNNFRAIAPTAIAHARQFTVLQFGPAAFSSAFACGAKLAAA